ncbi:MAG TPA: RDD family protein [Acidobacteriaceae bacterium]
MSGAAQKEEAVGELDFAATGVESAAALKQIASERLAAHRRRRGDATAAGRSAEVQVPAPRARVSRVRDAVAARYKDSVTYREFLAQEAERALEQAHAEAEVAARKAEAQMQLLEELQQWTDADTELRGVAVADIAAATEMMGEQPLAGMPPVGMSQSEAAAFKRSATDIATAGLTVRLYEDLNAIRPPIESARRVQRTVEADENERTALDAEIAFRRAPEFEPYVPQPVGISGNLIEFPRQLVAARKARPRLAEGPLREETAPEPQLRIFEVEPEQISAAPAEPASAPEWQSILLEGSPVEKVVPQPEAQLQYTMQPQTAPLELRLMAALVDGCCIAGAVLAFAVVVVELAGARLSALPLPALGAAGGGVAGAFFVLYQMLFFTLSEATPGMRYARIGLCTFADSNPARSAMRLRVLATLLAASPLGLGLAWAWLDEDRLGWQDRISRMYQRAY